MSSEVFILSAARNPDPAAAIRAAVERAGVGPKRVQDALFGFERSFTAPNLLDTARKAGLSCTVVSVSSSMRAIFFGAQSILGDGIDVVVVAGIDGKGTGALVLAGSEAVGRWNLEPRARLAARSLRGAEAALQQAGMKSEELSIVKQSESGARLVCELVDELETRQAQWGMVSAGELALLVERT